jgi:hypothetical protein
MREENMRMMPFTRTQLAGIGVWLALGPLSPEVQADAWYREQGLASYLWQGVSRSHGG